MKIIKKIVLPILLFISIVSYSQNKSKEEYDYVIKEGYKILTPSWNNITNMLSMSFDDFDDLMDEYNYAYESQGYIKQNGVGQPIYSISREDENIVFIWTGILDTREIERSLRSFYVGYDNGTKVYRTFFDGYTLLMRINNKGREGGLFMAQLF